MAETNEPKKVIIDEDWKNQAQQSKEKLEQQPEPSPDEGKPQLPTADFEGLVSIFTMQAYQALGLIRDPDQADKDVEPDWLLAKFHIDMLTMLEDKCRGNLSEKEEKLLKGTAGQLRAMFVQLSGKAWERPGA